LPIQRSQAEEYCREHGFSDIECERAYLISSGDSETFTDVLHGRNSSSTDAIQAAKTYLKNSTFQRLISQKEYAEIGKFQILLKGVEAVAEAALHSTHANNWEKILVEVQQAKELLANNVNTKLVYLRLSVML
jgi:hypothetical protein